MEVIEAIRSRRSIRRFKPDPVPREVLEKLLENCRWAPSSRNTQPWELLILGGKVMEEVKARLTEKVKAKAKVNLDVSAPDPPEPHITRAAEQTDRVDIYQFPPGTEKLDEKRAEYWINGGRFHNAPNGIFLCIERPLYPWAVFDSGIMAQTICLAALAHGLGACPTRRVVNWPDMLRETLGLPESKLFVLGIAIGYPDHKALVNNFPRHREPLDAFTHWHGF